MEATATFPVLKPFLSIQTALALVQVTVIFLLEFCKTCLSDFLCACSPLLHYPHIARVISAKAHLLSSENPSVPPC